ncbi:hypothetical protein V6N12_006474 [Hibiscus sabdariffa]|uniref:Uncharacterized protein n=1 Tax=Hibiscus sabdariffa TaxID=183260 RepID=A0ABR2EYX3_9ROSI
MTESSSEFLTCHGSCDHVKKPFNFGSWTCEVLLRVVYCKQKEVHRKFNWFREEDDAVKSSLCLGEEGQTDKSKSGNWSLVTKLLHHKRIACEHDGRLDINEFEKVDAALRSFFDSNMNVEMQSQLKDFELCMQNLEDGTECLFRCVIKARVSLLNMLNP